MTDQIQLPGMTVVAAAKRCGKCGETKSLSEFHRNKNSRDGHTNRCKKCAIAITKAWKEDNQERVKASSKEYRDSHKEEIAARDKRYRETNREKVLAKKAEYREAHREELAAKSREYYAEHREERQDYGKRYNQEHHEEILERQREYKKQNPNAYKDWLAENREKRMEYMQTWHAEHKEHDQEYGKKYRAEHMVEHAAAENRRRARKKNAPGSHTAEEFQALVDFYEVCPSCQEPYTDENPVAKDHIVPLSWQGTSDALDNIQPLCRSCNASKGNRHATSYRDRVREFMMRPDLHGPDAFMAVYRADIEAGANHTVKRDADGPV